MRLIRSVILLGLLSTGACGTLPEERAISGAGIGAASGAVVGAVTTLAVGPGALIGALGGGLVGALTHRDQVNLGEPAWKHGATGAAPATRDSHAGTKPGHGLDSIPDRKLVETVQHRLTYLGYEPGPVDGVYGRRTAAAIRRFQRDHGLVEDGLVTAALAEQVLETPKSGAFSI